MDPASWPAGLPEEHQVGLASNPRRRASFLAGKRMLTSRVQGKANKNQKRLSHRQSSAKWQLSPDRSSSSSVKHASNAAPIGKLVARTRFGCSDEAPPHQTPTVSLYGTRTSLVQTEDTRLRETSCRASRSHYVVRIWLSWTQNSLRSRCVSS